MTVMFVLLIILAIAAGVILHLGRSAPVDHEASLAQMFSASPETIYRLVRNIEGYPGWRTGVSAVTRDEQGRYVEETRHGKIPYVIVEEVPNERLVTRIDGEGLPFAGSWTFEISRQGGMSKLLITEHGSVHSPLMRFFAHYVMTYEKTIRTYLDDLGKVLDAGGGARRK